MDVIAVGRGERFGGLDGEIAHNHGGPAEIGFVGVEAQGLGRGEILWVGEYGNAGDVVAEGAKDVAPVGASLVAGGAGLAFTGEKVAVAGAKPGTCAANGHAAVVEFIDLQG